jgi:hypothetical protein
MNINRVLDRLFGCEVTTRVNYFLDEGKIWRETTARCQRCGQLISRSRRLVSEDEFWEDAALYLIARADSKDRDRFHH